MASKKPFKVIEAKSKDSTDADNSKKRGRARRIMEIGIGALLIGLTLSLYVQGLPLVAVFAGAMLGIPADGAVPAADMMIWGSINFGFVLLITYGVIQLCRGIIRKLILK